MNKRQRISRPRGCALKHFLTNLSEINKYLSYYAFISSQFLLQNADLIKRDPSKMTTEMFPDNELSKQFSVKLNFLQEYTSETDKFILDSLFLFCCFELDNYLKETYKNIQAVERFFDSKGVVPHNLPNKIKELGTDQLFKQVTENLEIVKDSNFTEQDFLTYDYFRLRRNTIAHRNIEARFSGSMKTFVEEYGNELNEYWAKSEVPIKKLDFTSHNLQFADRGCVIDVINILRNTTPKLEEKVLGRITEEEWVEYLFPLFKVSLRASTSFY